MRTLVGAFKDNLSGLNTIIGQMGAGTFNVSAVHADQESETLECETLGGFVGPIGPHFYRI